MGKEHDLTAKIAVVGAVPGTLVADLKRLGFTEYEARIYVQLLRESPATAYEISKSAGVPRPNTYHALEALSQRGAVLPVSETPVRYIAAQPKEFLDSLARRTSDLCASVGNQLANMAKPLDDQYVWTLTGESAVREKIASLIDSSQSIVMVKAADDMLRQHFESLRAAAARGVEFLIVLFGPNADEFRFAENSRVYIHEGNGVRMGTTDNLFTVTSDRKEMVTAVMAEEVTAVHTRNQPIVNMAESLIRHDYYMAEIFDRLGPQIDASFGPYLRDLRLACFTPEQAASFKTKTGLT
jgi:sugar-specific transcriptional regulator TrmB